MDIPFFSSKISKLKKMIKEGKFQDAQKFIRKNPKLMDTLIKFLNSKDPILVSNSIYLITKIYMKYHKNIMDILPYIRKCLKSDNENIVLNSLISLKIILSEYPDYYRYTEDELWYINRKFVNLQIREHTWDIIKKYGEGYILKEEEYHRMYERIKQLMNSTRQESLIKKLLNVGKSFINIIKKVEKLEINEKKIMSSISSKKLNKKLDKNYLEMLKSGKIKKSNPLTVAQCLSKLPLDDKSELKEVIKNVLELLFSKNKIVRNIALEATYNIAKYHPDLLYDHYDILIEYAETYGKSTTLELILKELSKKYSLEYPF